MIKKQSFKGSLNFLRRKQEAERVDYENLKMAKRIVTQDSQIFKNVKASKASGHKRDGSNAKPPSSKATLQISEIVTKHQKRMSETFGYFSRASPDETQYLPSIKPNHEKRIMRLESSQPNQQLNSSDVEETQQKLSKQLPTASSNKQYFLRQNINQNSSRVIHNQSSPYKMVRSQDSFHH